MTLMTRRVILSQCAKVLALIPDSKCSKPCIPGQYKIQSKITCCYNCSLCPEGYYSDRLDPSIFQKKVQNIPKTDLVCQFVECQIAGINTYPHHLFELQLPYLCISITAVDMHQCLMCPHEQWSTQGSSYCHNRTILYLDWKDPFAAALTSFAVAGFILVLTIAVIFLKHLSTPAVKAAGGVYTCIMNISLLSSFISSILFVGEPTNCTCKIRQPLYGISFTICVSCIFIKSFRVVLAFKLGQRVHYHVKYSYQPSVVILILGGVQTVVCTLWIVLQPPSVKKIAVGPNALIIQCDEGSTVLFVIMLAYNGFLAFVCFVLAYQERKLPEIYNEGRYITFSMLIYIFVWFAFTPVYVTTTGKYLPAVEVMAILASSFGVICCHLFPACYKIFFKSDSNKREVYLQKIQNRRKSKLSTGGITTYPSQTFQNWIQLKDINFISTDIQRKRSRSI
ncbi:G-protein coupled receptor family C group 6 member A-like [Gastrophryne carolinensis]